MEWCSDWESLFRQCPRHEAPSPRLGINYLEASAPETTIGVTEDMPALRLHQDLERHGIAGVVWNCARAMSAFLANHPSMLDNGHVLELGAGTGVLGLVLATTGRLHSLTLTDLDVVLPLTRQNVQLACAQSENVRKMADDGKLTVRELCWGTQADPSLAPLTLILCSDCLYDASQYPSLTATLRGLTDLCGEANGCASSPPDILLAYKQRLPEKEREFFAGATEHFDIQVLSDRSCGGCTEFLNDSVYICNLKRIDSRHNRPASSDSPINTQANSTTNHLV